MWLERCEVLTTKNGNLSFFTNEPIHKNIIFDSDVKIKKSSLCFFMLHLQLELPGVDILKEFNITINGTEVINKSPYSIIFICSW